VTADRGYSEKSVEDDLHDLGVRHVVIPRKGKPGKARQAVEHKPAFRRTVKWRTESEGRISTLKRGYGWDRTRMDNIEGGQDLDRARGPGPQPGQDRRPGQLTAPVMRRRPATPRPLRPGSQPTEFFRSK
jgi:transposase, IS5 family